MTRQAGPLLSLACSISLLKSVNGSFSSSFFTDLNLRMFYSLSSRASFRFSGNLFATKSAMDGPLCSVRRHAVNMNVFKLEKLVAIIGKISVIPSSCSKVPVKSSRSSMIGVLSPYTVLYATI